MDLKIKRGTKKKIHRADSRLFWENIPPHFECNQKKKNHTKRFSSLAKWSWFRLRQVAVWCFAWTASIRTNRFAAAYSSHNWFAYSCSVNWCHCRRCQQSAAVAANVTDPKAMAFLLASWLAYGVAMTYDYPRMFLAFWRWKYLGRQPFN